MPQKTILEKLNDVPTDRWYSLDEICQIIKSPSKTHVKMNLLIHPKFVREQVLVKTAYPMNFKSVWRWMFARIKDTP